MSVSQITCRSSSPTSLTRVVSRRMRVSSAPVDHDRAESTFASGRSRSALAASSLAEVECSSTLTLLDMKAVTKGATQVVVDVAAAAVAALSVTPFVAAVDKALAEIATGKISVSQSLGASARQMLASPLGYCRSPVFLYTWALFGGTYAAANTFTSYEEGHGLMPWGKTIAIGAVNGGLALWKDRAFARLLSGAPPKPVPTVSYAAWWLRDFTGMGVIFVAPPIVAGKLVEHTGMEPKRAEFASQVALPLMIQPFAAPLHLYGYVAYNSPDATRLQQMQMVKKELWGAVQMRWCRVFAPFCFGTTLNKNIRASLSDAVA